MPVKKSLLLYLIISFFLSLSLYATENLKTKECLEFSAYTGLAKYKVGYPRNIVSFNFNNVIYYKKYRRYSPLLISRWGLSSLVEFCNSGEAQPLNDAIAQANYLIKMFQKENNIITWPFNYAGGGNNKGYSSAISNASTIDLLLHLGYVTNNKNYIEISKLGALAFIKNIEQGGG